jgi:hypothetical protein
MPDRESVIDGHLVAEVRMDDTWPLTDMQHGDHRFLFRSESGWTLLTVQHITNWGEHEQKSGFGCVSIDSFPNLGAIQELYGGMAIWPALVMAGSKRDAELRALYEQGLALTGEEGS